MANEYQTSAAFKKSLSLAGETYADDDISLALEAASRGLDEVCDRRFYADVDANQVRYYSPWSKGLLVIDDLVTLTSLQTDPGGDGTFEETWTLNTDFTLEPLNAAAGGRPWEQVKAHPSGNYHFPIAYPRSVQITGRFGWSAVPPTIKQLTGIIAAKLLQRSREAPYGVVFGSESAARIAREDPDMMFLLRGFIRYATPIV